MEDENTNVTFENNCNSEHLVFADKDQITRVVNNLVKNAIQATEETHLPEIKVSLSEEDDMLLLTVSDNGVGIKPEQRDKIFVPNFTTKSTGMGLGLAMVQNIVHAADGDIWFESDGQNGSTFYVKLPLHTSENG
ncbi:MAG: HAMP domain-containing sensor histidine kinase [Bacteroidota bacterium]